MFIGGLNWDTTDGTSYYYYLSVFRSAKLYIVDGLRNYFSQFGKVEACTIMRDAGGRSRCFAFLTFDEPASVNAVMVREHFLDGKIVRSTINHYSTPLITFPRLTLSVLSQDKNINAQRNCSSEDWLEVLHQNLCANISLNLAE